MKKIFLLAILGLLFVNCSNDSESDISENSTESPSNDDNITPRVPLTYNRDIAPIINNSCMPCHGNPTTNGAPFGLTNFDEVIIRVDRMQIRMNDASRPMPVGGLLPASVRAQFDQWITDGRLEE